MTKRGYGILRQSGDEISVDVQGMASATVSVKGTFAGTIRFVGANNISAARGGRILFQSGVGSTGKNAVDFDGTFEREYRVVAGGERLIIVAENWVSGEAEIDVYATEDASLVFINGPVRTTFEEEQNKGRSYSVGTSTQAVTTGNYLQFRFENPSDSGKRYRVTERWFANDQASGAENLETEFFPEYATPLTGATVVTPNNLNPSFNGSDAVFEWLVDSTTLGTPALGQVLPNDGIMFKIQVPRILNPGQSFAYQIGGAGSSVNNAARVAVTFVWYEEDLQ